MLCCDFILPEDCKPCLFLSAFHFAKLIVPYPNFFESEHFEPIDLCSCFEPIFDPPPEQEAAWAFPVPEPTLENTSFYATDPDGTEYFYCGGTRIQ